MTLDQAARVIIRVWTSAGNKQFPGHNVGHISLQTPDLYMSLWPVPFTDQQISEYHRAGTLEQKYLKYFMMRSPDFHQTYEDDYQAEGNIDPEVTICLYSLDRYMLENEFHKLKGSTQGWRLIGSNLFVQNIEVGLEALTARTKTIESTPGRRYVENCASLVLKLLKAGGISQLVNVGKYCSFSSKTSSVVKPDDILELLIPAKLAELEKYPETQLFQFPNEVAVSILEKKQNKPCILI